MAGGTSVRRSDAETITRTKLQVLFLLENDAETIQKISTSSCPTLPIVVAALKTEDQAESDELWTQLCQRRLCRHL